MIVRMGQVCGSKATGAWGTTEWMPIMVKSSVSLGCFPEMTGVSVPFVCISVNAESWRASYVQLVNWVPLDAIGNAYIDWVVSDDEMPVLVNVVHPRPTSWDVVLRGIKEELGGDLPAIALDAWVAKLDVQSAAATAEDLARVVSVLDCCVPQPTDRCIP